MLSVGSVDCWQVAVDLLNSRSWRVMRGVLHSALLEVAHFLDSKLTTSPIGLNEGIDEGTGVNARPGVRFPANMLPPRPAVCSRMSCQFCHKEGGLSQGLSRGLYCISMSHSGLV